VSDDNFEIVVGRLKKEFLLKSDKAFAKAIGMSPTAFHNRKKTKSLPYPEIIKFSNSRDVNLNWVLTGDGPVYKKDLGPKLATDQQNVTILKHFGLIPKFKNPERGLENNQHLIGIEEASPNLYEKVSDYLKTTHETAKALLRELQGKDGNNKTGTGEP